jgi:hypothetical protein
MLGALAGVVHDRQCADRQQHNCGEDNQQWPLHRDLDDCGTPEAYEASNYRCSNEPAVNGDVVQRTQVLGLRKRTPALSSTVLNLEAPSRNPVFVPATGSETDRNFSAFPMSKKMGTLGNEPIRRGTFGQANEQALSATK